MLLIIAVCLRCNLSLSAAKVLMSRFGSAEQLHVKQCRLNPIFSLHCSYKFSQAGYENKASDHLVKNALI